MEALPYVCAALLLTVGVTTMVYGTFQFYRIYLSSSLDEQDLCRMKKYRTMTLCGIAAAVLGMAIYLITKYFI